jgi:hypothetical protein
MSDKLSAEQILSIVESYRAQRNYAKVGRNFGVSSSRVKKLYEKYKDSSREDIQADIAPKQSRYIRIMLKLFDRHSAPTVDEFDWERKELSQIAGFLGVDVPSNIGDNIYSIRHGREELPEELKKLALPLHWLLLPNGRGKYKFVKAKHFVLPHDAYLQAIKIPDSTPQIVAANAKGDEQAVLARVRYNRLLDIFLGISASALQSHWRTTVEFFGGSQIETDELYVGVDRHGAQYVIPVQAKGYKERIGAVQIIQDIYRCQEHFPHLQCVSIAAKIVKIDLGPDGQPMYTIAMMETAIEAGTLFDVIKRREQHYKMVPSSMISASDLDAYRKAAAAVA